jgi:hypothetical protein
MRAIRYSIENRKAQDQSDFRTRRDEGRRDIVIRLRHLNWKNTTEITKNIGIVDTDKIYRSSVYEIFNLSFVI